MTRLALKTGRLGKGGFSGLKPIKSQLWGSLNTTTSIANSDNVTNANILLTVANFPELASWMTVYDEMRILGGKLHFSTYTTTAGTLLSVGAVAVMFDPTAGAPASIDGPLQESFHSQTLTSPAIPYITKMHTLPFHTPKLTTGTANSCIGSNWATLDNTATPCVAVVHGFQSSLGPAGVVTLKYLLELDVEFRMRT
jgi:hypothetical protein